MKWIGETRCGWSKWCRLFWIGSGNKSNYLRTWCLKVNSLWNGSYNSCKKGRIIVKILQNQAEQVNSFGWYVCEIKYWNLEVSVRCGLEDIWNEGLKRGRRTAQRAARQLLESVWFCWHQREVMRANSPAERVHCMTGKALHCSE